MADIFFNRVKVYLQILATFQSLQGQHCGSSLKLEFPIDVIEGARQVDILEMMTQHIAHIEVAGTE